MFLFQHEERAFVLKFSAIEIYNEVLRDLLSAENTPLRLWDDAEVKRCSFSAFLL
jgi:centromeric protein E